MIIFENEQKRIPDSAIFTVFEAILFAAGYPVPYEKLALATVRTEIEIADLAVAFLDFYNNQNRGTMALILDKTLQICTREEYSEPIRTALGIKTGGKLSASSLEVLAIVAYNQPVTRAYIEKVRGVDSSYAVANLIEKQLIEQQGKLDVPGRPNLYGTTADFLRCFGLSTLLELPSTGLSPLDKMHINEQMIMEGVENA